MMDTLFTENGLYVAKQFKIKKFIENLIDSRPDLETVVLFGSSVSKIEKIPGDIDLLALKRNAKPQLDVFHELLDDKILEVTVIDIEKFERELRAGHPFALNIVRNGLPLYDRGLWNNFLRYKSKQPGQRFIASYLNKARKLLKEKRLPAATIYVLNALLLSQNKVDLSHKLDNLKEKTNVKNINEEILTNMLKEVFPQRRKQNQHLKSRKKF